MLLYLLTLPYDKSRRIHTKLVEVEAWAGGGGGTEKDKGGKWSLKAWLELWAMWMHHLLSKKNIYQMESNS